MPRRERKTGDTLQSPGLHVGRRAARSGVRCHDARTTQGGKP